MPLVLQRSTRIPAAITGLVVRRGVGGKPTLNLPPGPGELPQVCDDGWDEGISQGEAPTQINGRKPGSIGHRTFCHSGDLGDVIYGLAVIKAMGGGRLILAPGRGHGVYRTREQMTRQRAAFIMPLIAAQPYISKVEYSGSYPESVDCDLNEFRQLFEGERFLVTCTWRLVDLHLEAFGLPHHVAEKPWLTVPADPTAPSALFARSPRYHNASFPWNAIVDQWSDSCAFVGLPNEYAEFCHAVSKMVPYRRIRDALDLARLIAGSKVFVGNQSLAFSIAEGLKATAILEPSYTSQNCFFERSNLMYGYDAAPNIPPKTWTPTRLAKPMINWCSVYDIESGFGRISQNLLHRLKRFRVNFAGTRTVTDRLRRPSFRSNPIIRECPSVIMEDAIFLPIYLRDDSVAIQYWETTELPEQSKHALNRARAVIAPCKWLAAAFASQLKVPVVHVRHQGIDLELYHRGSVRSGTTVFGTSGRFRPDNPRKNIQAVIDAFNAAFNRGDDVQLQVKVIEQHPLDTHGNRNIKIIRSFWPESKMADWYRTLACYVAASSAGGWELQTHEAMACGCCVMACIYASHADYLTPSRCVPIEWTEVDAYNLPGKWAAPSIDSIIAGMRWVHANRDQASEIAGEGTRAAREITWESGAENLDKALEEMLC